MKKRHLALGFVAGAVTATTLIAAAWLWLSKTLYGRPQ